MNLRRLFVLTAAGAAAASVLTACGGGDAPPPPPPPAAGTATNPAALAIIENQVGTGAVAASGNTVAVAYTGWLYNSGAAEFKGTRFDGGAFSFRLGAGQVIPGFEQGVLGMQVGGTRTIVIPSALGYGAAGNGSIPPNAGLVFTVTLQSVQ